MQPEELTGEPKRPARLADDAGRDALRLLDLAIRGGTIKSPGLIARKLASSEVGFSATRAYLDAHGTPERLEELADHQLVSLGPLPEGRKWQMMGPTGMEDIPMEPWLFMSAPSAVHKAVLEGLGIGVNVMDHYRRDVDDGRVVRVLPEYGYSPPNAGLYVVYASRRHLTPKVRVFVDHVVEHLPPLIGGA